MTKYKVFFHVGNELGLKTKVEKDVATLDASNLRVDGPIEVSISLRDIHEVKLFRLHGLGRVIQIDYSGGRLFISVVRLMIGQFAIINFFRTGELHNQLLATAKISATL